MHYLKSVFKLWHTKDLKNGTYCCCSALDIVKFSNIKKRIIPLVYNSSENFLYNACNL